MHSQKECLSKFSVHCRSCLTFTHFFQIWFLEPCWHLSRTQLAAVQVLSTRWQCRSEAGRFSLACRKCPLCVCVRACVIMTHCLCNSAHLFHTFYWLTAKASNIDPLMTVPVVWLVALCDEFRAHLNLKNKYKYSNYNTCYCSKFTGILIRILSKK